MNLRAPGQARPRPAAPMRETVVALSVTTVLMGVALAAGVVLERLLNLPNILLVFLPVVLFSAVRYGLLAASLSSVLSVVATSFFLAPPTMSFSIADPSNAWALLIFLAVAVVTSSLAVQVRQRAAMADRHSRSVESLYGFSTRLAAISDEPELIAEAARELEAMLDLPVVLLVPGVDGVPAIRGSLPADALDEGERLAAAWCLAHGRPAGRGSEHHGEGNWRFLPLDAGRGTVGVLGLRPGDAAFPPDSERARLLDTLARQVAVNIERARLARDIHEAEMLAATEKLRSALLISVSHDLRTPLGSILGNVTGLRRYGQLYDDEMRDEALAGIEEETRRLGHYVDNLLHMTRIDAGALEPAREPVDLSDLAGSALARLDKRLAGHAVTASIADDLPMIPLDFVLAEQVLVNVLENAAKFAPSGTKITVSAGVEGRDVYLLVEDEGPGIAEADLPRIFERFFRASAGDHRPAGVGLGLAVCKGFVEAMGGRIEAGNRDRGKGAVFTIRFPHTEDVGA